MSIRRALFGLMSELGSQLSLCKVAHQMEFLADQPRAPRATRTAARA